MLPKIPGSVPVIAQYRSCIMLRHVSCISLLEWSTTSQMPWVYRISDPVSVSMQKNISDLIVKDRVLTKVLKCLKRS